MNTRAWNETFEERRVTYTQELAGRFIVVEHVPARVCRQTGETLFSPETVESIAGADPRETAPRAGDRDAGL